MSTRPRRASAPARTPLRVVRGGGTRRSSLVPAAIVLVVAVFAVAALQAYLGQEGLRVANLEREVRIAEDRFAVLRAELAERSSPERIATAADELGMVPAPDPVYLRAPVDLPSGDATSGPPYAAKRLLAGAGDR